MAFWVLGPPDTSNKLASWDKSVVLEGPVMCSANPDHQRDGKRKSDLSLHIPSRDPPDFIWTWYSECLIQKRVLDAFRFHDLRGFEIRHARAEIAATKQPLSLYELIVIGWAGVAPIASGIRLIEDCPSCGLKIYSAFENPSLLLDESQWDGSDFFIVWPLPRTIFISERAAQVIRESRVTGSTLKSPSELKPALLKELSPGRLSYWMPEKRAHELGNSLGIS